jgi:hypothetical protein
VQPPHVNIGRLLVASLEASCEGTTPMDVGWQRTSSLTDAKGLARGIDRPSCLHKCGCCISGQKGSRPPLFICYFLICSFVYFLFVNTGGSTKPTITKPTITKVL